MKKFLFVFLLLIPSIAFAHPGRTDDDGGHYDRSTGEYHYHHGYEAHQHPDGICPYDYNDRTGISSSSLASDSSYGPSLTLLSNDYYNDAYQDGHDVGYDVGYAEGFSDGRTDGWEQGKKDGRKQANTILVFSLLAASAIAVTLLLSRYKSRNTRKRMQEEEINRAKEELSSIESHKAKMQETIDFLQQQKTNIEQQINERKAEKEELENILRHIVMQTTYTSDMVQISEDGTITSADTPYSKENLIPPGIVIGVDGLPAEIDAKKHWGTKFTVYFNPKTHVYHRGSCRHVSPYSCVPEHIFYAHRNGIPCSICRPDTPDEQWFLDYKKLQNLQNKYLGNK